MLFVVAFGGLIVGGILILLIARYSPDAAAQRAEIQRQKDEAEGRALYPPIPFDAWRHLVIDILEALNFHITFEHSTKSRLDIIAKSTEPLRGGRFIIHAVHAPPGDRVDQTWVVKLQDTVRGEGASKGILMTPYEVDTSGLGNLEADIEIVDGQKVRELIEKYMPKKLDVIEGYRGFGTTVNVVGKEARQQELTDRPAAG